MSIWLSPLRRENFSNIAMSDVRGERRSYPQPVKHLNTSVARMTMIRPGIIEVESRHGGNDVLVISGGIHGDEKAGIVILDRLLFDIVTGDLPVHQNLLLLYGNLEAMQVNDGRGARCVEPEIGVTANLNRCFNRGKFNNPRCYAEWRANEMMDAVSTLHGMRVEAIDIHQSFDVPTLERLRDDDDRTEYTYAMLYPHDESTTLSWVLMRFSDIVAGAVLNDMSVTHHTWAGFMATEYGANAATFEQGTIGHVDHVTFTPQLLDNLRRSVRGQDHATYRQGFDVWRCVRGIVRETSAFTFLDADGTPAKRAPSDFVPIGHTTIARDADTIHEIEPDHRLLFANAGIPIGDRAAQVIVQDRSVLGFEPGEIAMPQ